MEVTYGIYCVIQSPWTFFLGHWVLEVPKQFVNASLLDVSFVSSPGDSKDPGDLAQEHKTEGQVAQSSFSSEE